MNIKELIEKYEYLNHSYFRRVDTSEVLRDLRQLDKPQKVVVPQFVADWIETAKKAAYNIRGAIDLAPKGKVKDWLELKNVNTFAKAWVNGYEVEKEKRYWVKLKAVDQYLVSAKDEKFLGFLQSKSRSKFTRKELEDLGFGWVFDCEGIEIEEVEE
jgi:phage protein